MFVFVQVIIFCFCFRILRLGEILCPIEVMNKTHSYICKLKDDPNEAFESYDSYVIELCHKSGCYNVTKERFQPCDNSKYDLIIIIV